MYRRVGRVVATDIVPLTRTTLVAVAAATLWAAVPQTARTDVQPRFVAIGTGGVAGVYYPTGEAICRSLNAGRERHGIRCSAEATGGSLYNLEMVRAEALEFGIAQSDWQYQAWHGAGRFADAGPAENLRSALALHAEPFTVLVRADSGIDRFDELAGRRVDAAAPGSSGRATLEAVVTAYGLTMDDLLVQSGTSGAESAAALCEGRVDAMITNAAHPDVAVSAASNACDVRFLDIDGAPIERLIAVHPFYRPARVPAGLYRGLESDCTTFGVGATLVTSAAVSDEVVYALVEAVLGDLEAFRRLHPVFAGLRARKMTRASLSAPLHPGAARYFRERGWL